MAVTDVHKVWCHLICGDWSAVVLELSPSDHAYVPSTICQKLYVQTFIMVQRDAMSELGD